MLCQQHSRQSKGLLKKTILEVKKDARNKVVEEADCGMCGKGYHIITNNIKSMSYNIPEETQNEIIKILFPQYSKISTSD